MIFVTIKHDDKSCRVRDRFIRRQNGLI